MKSKITYLTISIATTLVFSCKKYPENRLWFRNPTKMPVINGNIIGYRVNLIDSLPYLNAYYKPYTIDSMPPRPPYTNQDKNIYDEIFRSYLELGHGDISSNLGSGSYAWDDKKKHITIFFTPDNLYFKKNIFIAREEIEWEVLYLDKKGKSKIKTVYNGLVYEITFQN